MNLILVRRTVSSRCIYAGQVTDSTIINSITDHSDLNTLLDMVKFADKDENIYGAMSTTAFFNYRATL